LPAVFSHGERPVGGSRVSKSSAENVGAGPEVLIRLRLRCITGMEEDIGFSESLHLPEPEIPRSAHSTVKTARTSTLKRAGVPHFSIYTLRHVFCTRLSAVAPDAVVQRAIDTRVLKLSESTNSV